MDSLHSFKSSQHGVRRLESPCSTWINYKPSSIITRPNLEIGPSPMHYSPTENETDVEEISDLHGSPLTTPTSTTSILDQKLLDLEAFKARCATYFMPEPPTEVQCTSARRNLVDMLARGYNAHRQWTHISFIYKSLSDQSLIPRSLIGQTPITPSPTAIRYRVEPIPPSGPKYTLEKIPSIFQVKTDLIGDAVVEVFYDHDKLLPEFTKRDVAIVTKAMRLQKRGVRQELDELIRDGLCCMQITRADYQTWKDLYESCEITGMKYRDAANTFLIWSVCAKRAWGFDGADEVIRKLQVEKFTLTFRELEFVVYVEDPELAKATDVVEQAERTRS